jgi:hypothetical protein
MMAVTLKNSCLTASQEEGGDFGFYPSIPENPQAQGGIHPLTKHTHMEGKELGLPSELGILDVGRPRGPVFWEVQL